MEQIFIELPRLTRGFHIITPFILKQLPQLPQIGLLHLFVQHTSAGICINENADPTVLEDLNNWFNKNVKENESYYKHTYEGPDDMPAHIKSILTGCEITIPITNNTLNLGIWQGIYFAEFRNNAAPRKIIATVRT